MMTFGPLVTLCQDALTDNDEDARERLKRSIGQAYLQVCGMRDWSFLRRVSTLSVTSLTSTAPIYLPGDFWKAVGTIEGDDYMYFWSPSRDKVDRTHERYWYFADENETPLASGTTLEVAENGTAITSTAEFPTSDADGEYIRIGDNRGVYEIASWTSTSAMTLTNGFRGEVVDAGDEVRGYFEVRPRGTKRINFCDYSGAFVTPASPKLTYTVTPLPLYNDYDDIRLPGDSGALLSKALRREALTKGWTRLAQFLDTEFVEAYASAQRQEPIIQDQMKAKSFLRRSSQWRRRRF